MKTDITRASYDEVNIVNIVSEINGIAENDKVNTHRKNTKAILKILAVAAGIAVIIWTIYQFSTIKPAPTQ